LRRGIAVVCSDLTTIIATVVTNKQRLVVIFHDLLDDVQ